MTLSNFDINSAPTKHFGPTEPYSIYVNSSKHRLPDETFEQAMWRIAEALADDKRHAKHFFDVISDMRFLTGGRIQRGAGSSDNVCLHNCFASANFHDSLVHGEDGKGKNSIYDVVTKAAATMQQGGGIGYNVSFLRPEGDIIKGVNSTTDGPLVFMGVLDKTCEAISSAGNRRGAQMGIMNINHPDIRKFIHSKEPPEDTRILWHYVRSLPNDDLRKPELFKALQHTLKLTKFNISVGVTDYFMECYYTRKPFPLEFNGRIYEWVDPIELWDEIMEANWRCGEPGVVFIGKMNRMNNLYYCEKIYTTNPCSEIPLPPHGACLLGSFNVANENYISPGSGFNFDLLMNDIPIVVRAMDNVNDVARYPIPEQKQEAQNKRRMGLGLSGLANALAIQGLRYGSKEAVAFTTKLMSTITLGCYQASIELAIDKGAFPFFDADLYCNGQFIKNQLPNNMINDIRKHGIRNALLTAIAPTGSISMAADNISSSIEPPYMLHGDRRIKTKDGEMTVTITDFAYHRWGIKGETAADVSVSDHVNMLNAAAEWCDSSVSKTVNTPEDISREDFNQIYMQAWEGAAKGCTTFRNNCDRIGIMTKKELPAEGETCSIDPITGRKNCE